MTFTFTATRPKFEEALQQNEIMNVFYDDWMSLSSGKVERETVLETCE